MASRYLVLSAAMVIAVIMVLPSVSAVVVNSFSADKSSYVQGASGTANIVFLNDQGVLIQVTGVTMTFNYYYQDGRVYAQSFSTTGLSLNVTNGALSSPIAVKFSLPSDIAGGYFIPQIQVFFSEWTGPGWGPVQHDNSAATSPIYVQSAQYQSALTLQYLFIVLTVVFAGIAGFFALRYYSSGGRKAPSQTQLK